LQTTRTKHVWSLSRTEVVLSDHRKTPPDKKRSLGYLAMATCESPFVEAFEYWLDRSRDALRRCNATGVVMVNYPVAMFKSP